MNHPFIGTRQSTAKAELLAFINRLPEEIRAGINNGALKIVDSVIYASKAANGNTSFEVIQPSDKPKEGIRNIDSAKLESTQYFLLRGIRLQTATIAVEEGESVTDEQIATADFSGALNNTIANGELEILVAGKTAYPRNSCQAFVTGENATLKGYKELDCPALIAPLSPIVPTLRFGATTDTATDKIVARIELHGARIISA